MQFSNSFTSLQIIFIWLALMCIVVNSVPLRSLFLRSYDDMDQESVPQLYIKSVPSTDEDNVDNRQKRGFDLLKRRVEIIERNRCFFNPITCY